ncbi:putative IgE binding protein [Aspergillus clavatus NRRL 1]|uniref:IgE binding protein, putative n=1 Tax=Aspergillus clavatus (strain ATCC 1007 / CBS 513.65 / DSM 816 / NCTC 3887 / NRRL 1 / QM 1276 / 107) TaxID=344612 RepID=A1CS97_ASPCL|nr:IgE binding protein, putative [Aspergillus clavatus NRRL 1]EAW08518.1 IgE binding protein, putative [Aspergillus clavatus NRRL 1]
MKLTLLPIFAALAAAGNQTLFPFEVIANAPGTPVDRLRLAASNLSFSLGGQTTTFCPLQDGCPPGNHTVIDASGGALDVIVPGGQRIFINPAGAVSFTQAHSTFIPPGSTLGPFFQSQGVWHFRGPGAFDFMACPTPSRIWQVFAAQRNVTVPLGNVTACVRFVAVVIPFLTGPGAFQYV